MQELGPTLGGALDAARKELAEQERRGAALREWIEASERLLAATGALPAGTVPAPAQAAAESQAPSLRSTLRTIIAGLDGPITVAELVERLRQAGINPKDDDSVDSTLYNLKAAGVPVVKVAPRTWKRAEEPDRGEEAGAPAKKGDTRAA